MIDRKKLTADDIATLGWSLRIATRLKRIVASHALPFEDAATRAWEESCHRFESLAWVHRAFFKAYGGTMLVKGHVVRGAEAKAANAVHSILLAWYDEARS